MQPVASQVSSVISSLSNAGRVPEEIRLASAQHRHLAAANAANTVQYVMLDCSGTVMDKYVDAPAVVFVEVFKQFGVEISMQEARVPMGLRKDLHIKALTELPSIREKWLSAHGRQPNQEDVDQMFAAFVPMQLEVLRNGDYATLLPGTLDVATQLQTGGAKIGITTGFTRSMLDLLLAGAAKQGFVPDTSVAGDEVETPRPLPFMVIKNLERMGVENLTNAMRVTVKVDDTVSGAGEGTPMCWRVAVSRWSNYVVDSCDVAATLSDEELVRCERAAKEKLIAESGAHYVIDDLRGLPAVIDDINARLANCELP